MTMLVSPTGHSPSLWCMATFDSRSPPAGEADSIVCDVVDCVGRSRADRAIFSKLFIHSTVYASYVSLVTLLPVECAVRINFRSETRPECHSLTLKTIPGGTDKGRNRSRSIIFDRVHDRFSVQSFVCQFECIAQFVRLLG